jgi:hypothetical protein
MDIISTLLKDPHSTSAIRSNYFFHHAQYILSIKPDAMRHWGELVSNDSLPRSTPRDPALLLLQVLIQHSFERIDLSFACPTSKIYDLLFPEFNDWLITQDTHPHIPYDRNEMTCDIMDQALQAYNSSRPKKSTFIDILLQYHKALGERREFKTDKLVYSLSNRIWRDATFAVKQRLRATAFVFHTYYFFFCGDDASYYTGTPTISIRRDTKQFLTDGTLPHYKNHHRLWMDSEFEPYNGHSQFGLVARPLTEPVEDHFFTLFTIGEDTMRFYQHSDGSVSVTKDTPDPMPLPDNHYHLGFTEEYEEPVHHLFSMCCCE